MTTPTTTEHVPEHELVTTWHPSDVTKFIVGLLFAIIAAVVTAVHVPVTVSSVLQVVVVGVAAVGVYIAPYSSRAFASVKLWTSGLGAVLTALVPFVATYVDTGAWHNLTAVQWLVVVLAVGKAVGVYVVPNTTPSKIPAGWGPQDTTAEPQA